MNLFHFHIFIYHCLRLSFFQLLRITQRWHQTFVTDMEFQICVEIHEKGICITSSPKGKKLKPRLLNVSEHCDLNFFVYYYPTHQIFSCFLDVSFQGVFVCPSVDTWKKWITFLWVFALVHSMMSWNFACWVPRRKLERGKKCCGIEEVERNLRQHPKKMNSVLDVDEFEFSKIVYN